MSAKLDKITPQTPLRIRWLAEYLNVSHPVIHRSIKAGYRLKYPRIGMTTAAHYLEWCEGDTVAVDTSKLDEEMARFRQEVQATESASKRPEGRRKKAAGKSREPLSSHD